MVEFHTYELSSGQKQPKHFDAIILDLNMPIMDGYEACKQINQIYERLKQMRDHLKKLDKK